jgi:hypothetical protein
MVANRDNPIIRQEQFDKLVKEIKKTMAMKTEGKAYQSLWGNEPLHDDELARLREIFSEFQIEMERGNVVDIYSMNGHGTTIGSFLRIERKTATNIIANSQTVPSNLNRPDGYPIDKQFDEAANRVLNKRGNDEKQANDFLWEMDKKLKENK